MTGDWLLLGGIAWLVLGGIGAYLLHWGDDGFDLGTFIQIVVGPYSLAIAVMERAFPD